jgi:glucosamine-6-phosphate deaminase
MHPSCRVLELVGAPVLVFSDAASAAQAAADRIVSAIRVAVKDHGKAVLGLATGGTPVPVYERLVALYRVGELSFKDVITYNLDEYYPIQPFDPNSYRRYMQQHLFSHVDIGPNRAHVFDGTVSEAFAGKYAADFDDWIDQEGGLDLQLLGIGRNGHIGFNEPTELTVEQALSLPSRLVDLHPVTITDAAKDFGDESKVIRRALTVGVSTILASRSVLILALGANKADAVARALTGPMAAHSPASLLQSIPGKVTWITDELAVSKLESR